MPKPRTIKVAYAETVFGSAERQAVARVYRNPKHIVAGPAVVEFEKRIAHLFGKRCGVMVNSGSSANLLGLSVLDLPKGAEIITPALTFSTTLAPILQLGFKPVFADCEQGTYVVDAAHVASLITKNTRALVVPSLIGNIPDLAALRALARKHDLVLLEDSCDTIGATLHGKPTGTFSDISTTSFYASHIITAAGGGGMVCFHDEKLARRARVMGYWGRESTLFGSYERSEELSKRFAGKLEGEPYDAKFLFTEIGFNMQPLELHGAFGLVQLARLKEFSAIRQKNFRALLKFFSAYEDFFILPKLHPDVRTNFLAFPLTLREKAPFSRYELTCTLEEQGIQTRPIFTGNVLRQPAFRYLRGSKGKAAFPVADAVMRRGLLVGCHHGMSEKDRAYLEDVFDRFLKRFRLSA